MAVFYKRNYKKSSFRVKRPIRTFRDLEVYQRAARCAAEIMAKLVPLMGEGGLPVRDKLINTALRIPEAVAEAHSHRFDTAGGSAFLEGAMTECNKAVVYLEQARDIYLKDTEARALSEELVKRYILLRRKIFNLYKAWNRINQAYMGRKKAQGGTGLP